MSTSVPLQLQLVIFKTGNLNKHARNFLTYGLLTWLLKCLSITDTVLILLVISLNTTLSLQKTINQSINLMKLGLSLIGNEFSQYITEVRIKQTFCVHNSLKHQTKYGSCYLTENHLMVQLCAWVVFQGIQAYLFVIICGCSHKSDSQVSLQS